MLECAGGSIDFAKIYALNALLLPADALQRIVRLYRDADVICYSGGILFEHAHRRGHVANLLPYLKTLGDDERKR